MIKLIDDSSIHFSLIDSNIARYNNKNYYQKVGTIKSDIKFHLKEKLNLKHEEIYLLNNSTHCLLNILYGLSVQSTSLSIQHGCYESYRFLTNKKYEKAIPLLTHIDPNSGKVCTLDDTNYVLDAAQSIGTIIHHQQAITSDLLFFPLHKHLAMQTGISVLCIKNREKYPEISKIAKISESGTVNINIYNQLLSLLESGSYFFNAALLSLTKRHILEISSLGMKVITPAQSNTPFIVIDANVDLNEKLQRQNNIFSVKSLGSHRYRFSCYIKGHIKSTPFDCTSMLIQYLQRLL